MKNIVALIPYRVFLLFCMCYHPLLSTAQPQTCAYKDPLVTIDFGSNAAPEEINLSLIRRYNRIDGTCPDDGDYSFASYTADCFGGNWHSLPADHTAGDAEGRMMLVNASERPGVFFMLNIGGLKGGATYEFASWIVNICKAGFQCTTIPPLLKVTILSQGRVVRSFTTGDINPVPDPQWKRYSAPFTLPAESSAITLQIENENPGGCGNDFALDDITLRECIIPVYPTVPAREEAVAVPKPTPANVVRKPNPVLPEPKEQPLPQRRTTMPEVPPAINREKAFPKTVAVPAPIATRANPVIKQITTDAAELVIELYDNGQVDGDTVSIFHNNVLIQSRAALSEKPVTIKIKVDKDNPHHELVMVAENLGSIPPNTSLMIITGNGKRYEVFISSSEQKNAKILIDLK